MFQRPPEIRQNVTLTGYGRYVALNVTDMVTEWLQHSNSIMHACVVRVHLAGNGTLFKPLQKLLAFEAAQEPTNQVRAGNVAQYFSLKFALFILYLFFVLFVVLASVHLPPYLSGALDYTSTLLSFAQIFFFCLVLCVGFCCCLSVPGSLIDGAGEDNGRNSF